MEPRIQYAQTTDGVSIAFYAIGEGTPLVYLPAPFTYIATERQISEYRRYFARLADKRKFVRYDNRGTGLSERDVTDYSLDAYVLDLEAVVERLNLKRLALCASSLGGPAAIAFAARHPERVSHLILLHSYARASDMMETPQMAGLFALMDKDWGLFTETLANVGLGWSAGEPARVAAALMREQVTPEATRAALTESRKFDVTGLLTQVKAPTLVLHRRQLPYLDVSVARGLVSRIPDARLVLLDGEFLAPYLGDTEALLGAIEEFLGEGEEAAAAAAPSGLVTILFTDMEGSTTLTQRLGDAKAQEVLHAHNRIVRDALKGHGGSEVKHTGDGIMASFPSAARALECAIAMQRAFAAHSEGVGAHGRAPLQEPIRVRIGLNAGEPVAEEKDLFGTAVQLAARICAQAEPGQILASDVVRQLAAGRRFVFANRGEVALRGFDDPVRLYEVRWRAHPAAGEASA